MGRPAAGRPAVRSRAASRRRSPQRGGRLPLLEQEAITADIDKRRHALHIAIENFENDSNIGTVVRTANAFAVDTVHIVGRRRWNRRGAMVTDRYQHLMHHATVAELLEWASDKGLTVVAIDNTPGCVPLETAELPERCLLLFGQEGPGVTRRPRTLR